MKTRWIVYELGRLGHIGDVIKFSYVAPSYAKRFLAFNVFCPQLAATPPTQEDVQISILVNNEAQIPVCCTFSLGINNIDNNTHFGKPLVLDTPINKGERISGYVEKLTNSFGVDNPVIKLHILCELEESDTI